MDKYFFELNKPEMVVYVERWYNIELNELIKQNYEQIKSDFSSYNLQFCYLPFLFRNMDYWEKLGYNRPYLIEKDFDFSVQEVYDKIYNYFASKGTKAALVHISDAKIKSLFPLGDTHNLTNLSEYARLIDDTIEKKTFRTLGRIAFRSNENFDEEADADTKFDEEAYRLVDEVRERVKQLRELGSLKLINDLLEEIMQSQKTLSPLFITNDYRIFLKDYGMKEVLMPPLSKCLFFLFLRHPEGILFKRLSDYHDELLSIYRNVTVREDIETGMESIRAMTNPLDNSVNEKCSRIRAAFLEKISDEMAQYYYITGKRSEPKKIILDRELVEYQ